MWRLLSRYLQDINLYLLPQLWISPTLLPQECVDSLDLNLGEGECGFYQKSGFTCETFFCPDCQGSGYCDMTCGFCTR